MGGPVIYIERDKCDVNYKIIKLWIPKMFFVIKNQQHCSSQGQLWWCMYRVKLVIARWQWGNDLAWRNSARSLWANCSSASPTPDIISIIIITSSSSSSSIITSNLDHKSYERMYRSPMANAYIVKGTEKQGVNCNCAMLGYSGGLGAKPLAECRDSSPS